MALMKPVELHLHFHGAVNLGSLVGDMLGIAAQLAETLTTLDRIERTLDKMKIDLTGIEQEVTDLTTVQESAIALLNGLSGKIAEISAELADNPVAQAKLNELTTAMDTSSNALAAAVAANTPAAPPA